MLFLATNFLTQTWAWLVHLYQSMDALKLVEGWMGNGGGYAVLFGLLASCGLGMPLPEDIPLMLAGYFCADGRMNLLVVSLCAWFGIMSGDCVLYALGRKFGLEITKVPVIGHHVSKERIERAHVLFEKYGVWVVAVGRLFAGIRGAMVVTAGAIRFTFWHFIVADGLAAVFSGGLFIAVGYWARKHFGDLEQMKTRVETSMRIVLAGVVCAILLYALWQWWQNKRKEKQKQAIIQHAKHREAASKANDE